MSNKRLLMISTDRLIFDEKSDVRIRQIEYAKDWDQVHIIVFTTTNSAYPKQLSLGENCRVYSTQSSLNFFYPFDAIKIGSKIIKENSITDITCQDPFLTAMAGVALKNKYKAKLEIQIHTDLGSPYFVRSFSDRIRIKLAKKYLPNADKIRVVSERIKEYIRQNIGISGKTEIEVRPIKVDKQSIKLSPVMVDLKRKYKQFKRIVLMASRLEKEKNIDLAIKSWVGITKDFPGTGLIIVGSGSEEDNLKKLVVNKSLDKSIVFENWVDKQTLYSYYKTADLFLNTSFFEGYGMTLVEANAAGCRIISTDVGIAKELGVVIIDHDQHDLEVKVKGVLASVSAEK